MGIGKLWGRGRSRSAGSPKQMDPAALEAEAWDWFTAALAWTMFNLSEGGAVVLTTDKHWCAQFVRNSGGMQCEVPANGGGLQGEDQMSPDQEAFLAARGWREPEGDNWVRELAWPAQFGGYEELAGHVVTVIRDVFGVWLPFELRAETIHDNRGELPDVRALGLKGYAAENFRTQPLSTWAELVALERRIIEADKNVARAPHQLRAIIGPDYLQQRGVEILTGGDEAWPRRDRTVDFIGLVGSDHLLVVDVVVDLDDPDHFDREVRAFDGRRVEQGSRAFVHGMVRVDPDLRQVLSNRPALASALTHDEVRIDYLVLAMGKNQRIAVHRFDLSED
ncbi:hypothetical protein ACFXHA_14615 [Nocardia sp. NPDC059240]|uniref:TY-Chap domain-containing protein n=1 Tax=Nocardia sp. NPDC059240 TaxID=3346786 RepID=UPI00368BDDC3